MKRLLAFLVLPAVMLSCTTTRSETFILDDNAMLDGREWFISFRYDLVEDGTDETMVVGAAQIQLLDDIYYSLKSNGIMVFRDNEELENQITVHAVYDILPGQFRTVDIVLMDSQAELSRIKLTNGDGRSFNPGRDNSELAEYAARQIIALITEPR